MVLITSQTIAIIGLSVAVISMGLFVYAFMDLRSLKNEVSEQGAETNTRLDHLQSEADDVKVSLNNHSQEIAASNEKITGIGDKVSKIEEDIEGIREALKRIGSGIFVTYSDDFEDNSISTKWNVSSGLGLEVIEQNGVIREGGYSKTPLSIGQLTLNDNFLASPYSIASVQANIRLINISNGTDSTGRMVLWQDPDNFLVFGMLNPTGVYFQIKQGPDTLTQTLLNIPYDSNSHKYRVEYNGYRAALFLDGVRLTDVSISLDNYQYWLQAHTNYQQGGAVIAEFDNFEARAVSTR